ncbi:DUF72 domain-containing protein [Sphingomonas sp. ASY06-1R]|uniref:DUF72 domain-containing protein n=1 Tax=Sphingomonas sp. ASY06-1R TaxID=3445771 RepID=UPI003FA31606
MTAPIVIGTAGWSIPAACRDAFPAEGSALARYAARFGGVEINSSFHRRHRQSTWTNWADSVPGSFRFAVKLPKEISHRNRLADCNTLLADFLAEIAGLRDKLAILLLQLPPSLVYAPTIAAPFLTRLAGSSGARIACEPRHPSWFTTDVSGLFEQLGIARVAADPAPIAAAAEPGGSASLHYWRLHGSPVMYRSAYGRDRLQTYLARMQADIRVGRSIWCMFDNTASSAAMEDALMLDAML